MTNMLSTERAERHAQPGAATVDRMWLEAATQRRPQPEPTHVVKVEHLTTEIRADQLPLPWEARYCATVRKPDGRLVRLVAVVSGTEEVRALTEIARRFADRNSQPDARWVYAGCAVRLCRYCDVAEAGDDGYCDDPCARLDRGNETSIRERWAA